MAEFLEAHFSKELYLSVTCLDSNNLWIFMIVVTGLQEKKNQVSKQRPLALEYRKRQQPGLGMQKAGCKGDS